MRRKCLHGPGGSGELICRRVPVWQVGFIARRVIRHCDGGAIWRTRRRHERQAGELRPDIDSGGAGLEGASR